MKFKLFFAFLLFAFGVLSIIDWIVFAETNKALGFESLKAAYINHLPAFMQSFYGANVRLIAFLFFVGFIISGVMFLKEKSRFFKIMAVPALLFGFWELFSLM